MARTGFLIALATCLLLSACGGAPADQPAQAVAPAAASMVDADASPMAVSTASAAYAGTCEAQIGEAAAQRLVERCLAVSPATHPPCNAQNACETIQGEIDRACAMYGAEETRPPECSA